MEVLLLPYVYKSQKHINEKIEQDHYKRPIIRRKDQISLRQS